MVKILLGIFFISSIIRRSFSIGTSLNVRLFISPLIFDSESKLVKFEPRVRDFIEVGRPLFKFIL
ncbi:hypothetical protein RB653_010571 [Dictyostelium firmibasis]|uniref:Uncharacterized protein n=1 Tax=Dictyostelium firmibasis TaxID=79012 RepID=A0AAN7U1Y4_9MYCE